MVRSLLIAVLATAMGTSALVSCTDGPGREDVTIQRLETALCEKRAECNCSSLEPETCGEWIIVEGFEMVPPPELAYDAACQDRWLAWVDSLSCQTPTLPPLSDLCPIYHGTIREGMDCSDAGIVESQCERGLLCIAGRCRDPGQTSFGEIGEPCDFTGRCNDAQALCIDGLCQRLPASGEPCLAFECAPDFGCTAGRCQPLPVAGEQCQASVQLCATGSVCQADPDPGTGAGRCEPLRDVGQPCQGHAECLSANCPAGVCAPPAGVGDPCSGQLPCGPSSLCFDNVCQPRVDGALFTGSLCDLLSSVREPRN